MSFRRILASIRRADLDHGLIEDGDRICVGVSGGKDSVLLFHALNTYRHVKRHYDHAEFTVIGIHIDMGFPGNDLKDIVRFAEQNDIPFAVCPSDLYETLLHYPEKNGSLSCSRCSIMRKGVLRRAAQENECNKIAYGHHAEDAAVTLLMNMFYGSRIAVFQPKLKTKEDDICFIRPLIYVHEDEITAAVFDELQLPVAKSLCPNDGNTARQEVSALLRDIYQRFPESRTNILNSLSNCDNLSIWKPRMHKNRE